MDTGPLYLEPRLAPRLGALLGSAPFLHMLVDALGSPLGVLLPDQIAENAEGFRSVYRRHRLGGQVFFAHKANRSRSLVRRLTTADAAVDVASLGELRHALGDGFTADRIMATGPKDPAFLWLAARSGVTVNADGPGELEALAGLVRRHDLPRPKVLLRLSEFETSGPRMLSRRSRFGTSVKALGPLLDLLERHRDSLDPVGVAYHLDTTSPDEKAIALEGCLRAMDDLRLRGFQPRAVDIGGGFGVGYLAHAAQWDRYTSELAAAVMGRRPPLTWGGHGYGLHAEGGTLRGALSLYPAHRPVAGAGYLDALLSQPAPTLGRPLGTLLLESLYDLYTEPGRALADQCGLSLARVLEVRHRDAGPAFVRLAMNANDVSLEDHGILMDPVLVPRDGEPAGPQEPVGVHLMGNLCLEADLVTRRTVFLPRLPRPGDLLGFANTAGYCMDFSATRAQQQPVARKVAVREGPGGSAWRWCLDEEYWPIEEYRPITDSGGRA
ncbi:Y4yA family PLP-dependent enzyme [Streptomyces sp. A1547]|uniref:Y4yA family PLP-dependent enzyme n=1 Tax=Streptomyces sp. A1547 TaxID=2563105 RepID=UPI00109ED2A6|nr:Y4yA family PLP-dependent enzyme [Streptomyces sp. A1547]THA41696.1 Y4yA family PLP-dependent enzyme [Streptomyces sp. A1547]